MRRLFVVGMVAAAMLAVVPFAGANTPTWRTGWIGADTKDASSSYSGFRASKGWAESGSRVVEVAAHLPGGWDLYGSWFGAYGYMCHGYAGSETLGALIWNPHSVSQNPMTGELHYPSWEVAC